MPVNASANDDNAAGEYIVSEARTSMFISGAVGMSERNGVLGDHDPEMRFNVIPWPAIALTKAVVISGVMSRSPWPSPVDRGLGVSAEKGAAVAGKVLAHVRSKFGSVTKRSTDTL